MGRTVSSRAAVGVVGFGLALACVGCGGGSSGTSPAGTTPTTAGRTTVPASISLTSPVLAQGRPMPRRFTCDGLDDPPPLRWSGVPTGTAELALLLEDQSARGESGGPFVHWSLFGIPASATQVPGGGKQGTNDFHQLTARDQMPESRPVLIGDGVWIGTRAVILPGVTIGRGAVVGAGSVVTSDIAERSLAVGNPARVIRKF